MNAPSPTAHWSTTPAPRRRRGGVSGWLAWRAIMMVVGLVFAGGAALWDRFGPVESVDVSAPVPQEFVDRAWPTTIKPIADFVEAERGLRFDHSVPVEFLSEEEYVEFFGAEWAPPSSEVREEYARLSDLYDAAGLAVDLDLLAAESTVLSEGTLGVYLPHDDTVYIRGTVMTPAVRAVVAHELTHALQEQHFDLILGRADDLELRSIIEADALRVERAYVATLTADEQESATLGNSLDADTADVLSTVPDAIIDATNAPYVLGPLLVDTAFERDGNAGVNELLRNPPTEELLLSPWLFGETVEDAPPLIEAPEGAVVVENVQQLSMIDMLAMLDAWLPWTEARGSLDGWNGGGYVSYVRDDGVTCFSVSASFETAPEAFASAVANWAALSGSSAVPAIEADRVNFEACDRGAGARTPPEQTVPLTVAAYIESTALLDARPDEQSGYQCLARGMIDDPQVGPLFSRAEITPDEEAIIAWVRGVEAARCGVVLEDS